MVYVTANRAGMIRKEPTGDQWRKTPKTGNNLEQGRRQRNNGNDKHSNLKNK